MEATTAASTPLPDTSPMTTTKRPSPNSCKSKKSPPTTADSVADRYREAVEMPFTWGISLRRPTCRAWAIWASLAWMRSEKAMRPISPETSLRNSSSRKSNGASSGLRSTSSAKRTPSHACFVAMGTTNPALRSVWRAIHIPKALACCTARTPEASPKISSMDMLV